MDFTRPGIFEQMAFRVRAMTYPLQVFDPVRFDSVGRAPVNAAVDRLPVGPRYTRQVERSLHAALDFERIYSNACQCTDLLKQAQVFRIEDISPARILLHREKLHPGAFPRQAPRTIGTVECKSRCLHSDYALFAAGGALGYLLPPFPKGGGGDLERRSSGSGPNRTCTWRPWTNISISAFDFFAISAISGKLNSRARFIRRTPCSCPEFHARGIGRICLGAKMNWDLRGVFAGKQQHARVRDYESIDLQFLEIFEIGGDFFQVRLARKNIDGYINLFAEPMSNQVAAASSSVSRL